MDLSFSGAGFMGCYYFGVVDCWNKYIPRERVNRVAGASAGSLIAAYYLMDLKIDACLKKILELSEDIRRRALGVFDRSNQIVDVLPRTLDELFPDDAHKQVSGRLHVCMTRLKDMKKVIVNEFETRQDLIDALNCSCFIPVWSGNHVSTYKGVKHIDGGFSDNLPVFDEHTIRICCFSGETDISPYDRIKSEMLSGSVFNMPIYASFGNCRRFRKALFPPPASFILSILELGFHDTKQFILSNDLIQCEECYRRLRDNRLPLCPKISPTITPNLSRSGSQADLSSCGANNQEGAKYTPVKSADGLLAANNVIERQKADARRFGTLLNERLQTHLSSSNIELNVADQNNNAPPAIVISAHESEKTKSNPQRDRRGSMPVKRVADRLAERRNTVQTSGQLLEVEERFRVVPNPLPSCPPSPNLNRHCVECIRMRQEARVDKLEDLIKTEALKHINLDKTVKSNRLRSKLTSPIKWIRQIGVTNSYNLGDVPSTRKSGGELAA